MSDWQEASLADLADYINGRAIKPEECSTQQGIPVIRIKQINDPQSIEDRFCGDDLDEKNIARSGDLLFSWSATLKTILWKGPTGAINQHIFKVLPKEGIDKTFLHYLIDHSLPALTEESHGSTMKHIKKSALSAFRLQIPPLPEQKKIAEILSGIDRSIQSEVNMASKITKQYQGVLSQIFDDASKRIPLGDYLPLGDLDLDISDGNYSAKYPSAGEFVERGVPFIRASNMKEGTIDDKDMRFISEIKHQEITKGHLKSGDILIANRGEIGKTSRVPERHIGSNINAQVVRINGGNKIDSSFLFHYLSSPFCQTLIDELTTGTALKQLPIGNLVKLLIPAPEMSVQIATGGALDSMQRAMNAISEKIRKRSQLKQALATDLLSGRKRVSV